VWAIQGNISSTRILFEEGGFQKRWQGCLVRQTSRWNIIPNERIWSAPKAIAVIKPL
jgi:hypothetical protein